MLQDIVQNMTEHPEEYHLKNFKLIYSGLVNKLLLDNNFKNEYKNLDTQKIRAYLEKKFSKKEIENNIFIFRNHIFFISWLKQAWQRLIKNKEANIGFLSKVLEDWFLNKPIIKDNVDLFKEYLLEKGIDTINIYLIK